MDDLSAMARDIVDANVYMTIGTASADGTPWATPVFFATHAYREFYWISSPNARHSRNISVRPEVSIVIFDSTVRPGDGRAVYMEARAFLLTDPERALGFYPGDPARGARRFEPSELTGDGPYRMYRATVARHWVLHPDRSPDQRVEVHPVG